MTGSSCVDGADMVRDVRPPTADISAWPLAASSAIRVSLVLPGQRSASRLSSRSSRAFYRGLLRAISPAPSRVLLRACRRALPPAPGCAAYRAVEWAFHVALLCAIVARVSPLLSALSVSRWAGRIAPLTRGAAVRPILRVTGRLILGVDARAVVGVPSRVAMGSMRGVVYRPCMGVGVSATVGGYRARYSASGSAHVSAAPSAWCHAEAGRLITRFDGRDGTPCCPRGVPRLARRYQRVTCRVLRGVS